MYKGRRYYSSSVSDFVTAFGKWEGSGVTGDCYATTVTTQAGQSVDVYAQIGCSTTNSNIHDKLYLNYFTNSACTVQAVSSWWSNSNNGNTEVSISSKEISSIEKYTAMGVNWWSNKQCSSCVRNGYDICDNLLCQSSLTECRKGSKCYDRIMEATGKKREFNWQPQLVGFLAAFLAFLWVAWRFVDKAKKGDNNVGDNLDGNRDGDQDDYNQDDYNSTSDMGSELSSTYSNGITESEMEMSEYHVIT